MIDINFYKSALLNHGANLAQVRRNQSDAIINATFTGDPTYKKCKILTSDGWNFVDAKYQKHTTPSILKDEVDYYLQFRPGVHYPLGTYVIVPDDTSPEINTGGYDDPFDQEPQDRTQWWIIVGKTDANAYVRYSILKCNFDFKWIYNGEIRHCYGCIRNASSYTSGIYYNDRTITLDNITSAWIPDVCWTYSNIDELGLDDTRSIKHDMRFMITDNSIHPKVFRTSKVTELVPPGIIKLTLKQEPFNEKTDNIFLGICDYYDDDGDPIIKSPTPIKPTPSEPDVPTSSIHWGIQNDNGELIIDDGISDFNKNLRLNKSSYFVVKTSDNYDGHYVWNVRIDDSELDKYTTEEENALKDYIKISDFGDGSCALKPARVKELLGNKFILCVSDEFGEHYAEISMEVTA